MFRPSTAGAAATAASTAINIITIIEVGGWEVKELRLKSVEARSKAFMIN